MNILLVEDESRIAHSIVNCLQQEGFSVEHVEAYDDLVAFLQHADIKPSIFILDRLLGDQDSLSLLSSIRKQYPHAGILILSAISSVGEKTMALDGGADDYLAKPFALSELTSRVKALSRRALKPNNSPFIKHNNLVLDLQSHSLLISGKTVRLPNREYLILKLLLQNPGRVYSKIQMIESMWENDSESETNVVESTISSLRRRLEDLKAEVVIKNMRNVGYWIET